MLYIWICLMNKHMYQKKPYYLLLEQENCTEAKVYKGFFHRSREQKSRNDSRSDRRDAGCPCQSTRKEGATTKRRKASSHAHWWVHKGRSRSAWTRRRGGGQWQALASCTRHRQRAAPRKGMVFGHRDQIPIWTAEGTFLFEHQHPRMCAPAPVSIISYFWKNIIFLPSHSQYYSNEPF